METTRKPRELSLSSTSTRINSGALCPAKIAHIRNSVARRYTKWWEHMYPDYHITALGVFPLQAVASTQDIFSLRDGGCRLSVHSVVRLEKSRRSMPPLDCCPTSCQYLVRRKGCCFDQRWGVAMAVQTKFISWRREDDDPIKQDSLSCV